MQIPRQGRLSISPATPPIRSTRRTPARDRLRFERPASGPDCASWREPMASPASPAVPGVHRLKISSSKWPLSSRPTRVISTVVVRHVGYCGAGADRHRLPDSRSDAIGCRGGQHAGAYRGTSRAVSAPNPDRARRQRFRRQAGPLAGTMERTVTVPIADDALHEPDEQFTVSLQAAVNATVATAQGNRHDRGQRPRTGTEHRRRESGGGLG